MKAQTLLVTYWTFFLATAVGCSRGPVIEVDPDALPFVQCKFQISGKDIEDGIVSFHDPASPSLKIIGNYDSETDTYRFVTKEGNTKRGGVPQGEYKVTIKPGRGTKVKIPAKYADPAKSDLKAEIAPGSNFLPPFELTL